MMPHKNDIAFLASSSTLSLESILVKKHMFNLPRYNDILGIFTAVSLYRNLRYNAVPCAYRYIGVALILRKYSGIFIQIRKHCLRNLQKSSKHLFWKKMKKEDFTPCWNYRIFLGHLRNSLEVVENLWRFLKFPDMPLRSRICHWGTECRHWGPACSFLWILQVVQFPVKHVWLLASNQPPYFRKGPFGGSAATRQVTLAACHIFLVPHTHEQVLPLDNFFSYDKSPCSNRLCHGNTNIFPLNSDKNKMCHWELFKQKLLLCNGPTPVFEQRTCHWKIVLISSAHG